ncbi:MAG: hypothetical protein PHI90_00970 [Clostridia bacterium]|nr:hypothetical protein [Clostridia bacterium]MDD4047395.1 hypothetical protein [Clostridia bacterium]
MGWSLGGIRKPNIETLEEEILSTSGCFETQLLNKLKLLDFGQGWEIVKKVMPDLEKRQTRDLVRLMFSDKVEELIELLKDRTERLEVIECLGYIPARKTVEILASLLVNKDSNVQLVAAGALKNHTPRLVVPYIVELLLKSEVAPSRAGEVLLEMDFLAREELFKAYDLAKPKVKGQILEILTASNDPKCKKFINSALLSEEVLLKRAALTAVEKFVFKDLWLEVAICLTDPIWQIRAKALEVLARLGVKDASELVTPFLDDVDPWVQKGAKDCLEVLNSVDEERVNE